MSLVQQLLGSGEIPSEMFQEHVLFLARTGTFAVRLPFSWALQKVSTTWPLSHYGSKSPLPLRKNLLIAFGSLGSSK